MKGKNFTLIELLVVSSCYFMRIHAKSRLEQHMRLANKSAFFGGGRSLALEDLHD